MARIVSFVMLFACLSTYANSEISQENNQYQTNLLAEPAEALVLVVSAGNSISTLTKKEIIDIYMGRFKTFPNDTLVMPIDFPEESEQKQLFYKLLVNRTELNIKAYWSRLLFSGRATPPIKANSKKQVILILVNNPNGLAYIQEKDVTSEMKIVYRL